MKQYVFDFANDILAQDETNELMREEIKQERLHVIQGIVLDYASDLFTATEAVYAIARYVKGEINE